MKNTVRERNDRTPLSVAIGVSEPDIDATINLARYAEQQGADYLVVMPVYISRGKNRECTRRGNVENLLRVIDATSKPIILYTHAGKQNGKHLRTRALARLVEHPRVVAFKASCCDERRFRQYAKKAEGHAKAYIGDSTTGLWEKSDGVVAGDANVLPVAWYRAITGEGYAHDGLTRLRQELARFQQQYKENPVAAFKMILHTMGLLSQESMFDTRLEPTPNLTHRVESLCNNPNFRTMYAW